MAETALASLAAAPLVGVQRSTLPPQLETINITGHPTHGDFIVEVPVGMPEVEVREYISGLDLDLMLGFDDPSSLGETNVEQLKAFENSVGAGKRKDKWFPHNSLEGGTDTVAYGHKLTQAETETGMINIGGTEVDWREGLSDDQAIAILNQDAEWAKHVAGASLVKANLQDDIGKVQALTSLIFNVGAGAWGKSKAKKFLEAGMTEDFLHEAFSPDEGFVKINGIKSRGLVRRRAAEQQLFSGVESAPDVVLPLFGKPIRQVPPDTDVSRTAEESVVNNLSAEEPDLISRIADAFNPISSAQASSTVQTPEVSPTLRRGSKDTESIGALQDALGMEVGGDRGIFGPKTEAAVKAFQTANGLTPDGIVGKNTWGKLPKKGQSVSRLQDTVSSIFGGNDADEDITSLSKVAITEGTDVPEEVVGSTFNLLEIDHAQLAINQVFLSLAERSGLSIPNFLKRDITEGDFSNSFLTALKEVSLEKIRLGNDSTRYAQFPKAVTDVIYKSNREEAAKDNILGEPGVILNTVLKSFVDPRIAVAFAVGRSSNVYIDDRGHVIYEDVYDYEDDGDNIVGKIFGPDGLFPVSKENARKIRIDLGPANSTEVTK